MTNDQKVHLLTNDETCSSLGDELFSSFVTASERQLSKDVGCLYWPPHRIGWEDRPRWIGGSLSLDPPPDRVGGPPPRSPPDWGIASIGSPTGLGGGLSPPDREPLRRIKGPPLSDRGDLVVGTGTDPTGSGRDRFRRVDVRSDFVISEAILGVTQGEINVATLPRGNFLG